MQYESINLSSPLQKSILGASVKPFVPRGSFAFIGYKGKVKHLWVNQKYALNGKGGTSLAATIKIKPGMSAIIFV